MRKYRMTANGERPVWASAKSLVRMGQEWAESHFRGHRATDRSPAEPLPVGNLTHDEACARRWHILTGKHPSWFIDAN